MFVSVKVRVAFPRTAPKSSARGATTTALPASTAVAASRTLTVLALPPATSNDPATSPASAGFTVTVSACSWPGFSVSRRVAAANGFAGRPTVTVTFRSLALRTVTVRRAVSPTTVRPKSSVRGVTTSPPVVGRSR